MKTANHSGHEHCDACADTGWCILTTTTTVLGVTYTDGCAPCRWCEQGALRYTHARMLARKPGRHEPLSQYAADVVEAQTPDAHYRPLAQSEGEQRRLAIIHRLRTHTKGIQ